MKEESLQNPSYHSNYGDESLVEVVDLSSPCSGNNIGSSKIEVAHSEPPVSTTPPFSNIHPASTTIHHSPKKQNMFILMLILLVKRN